MSNHLTNYTDPYSMIVRSGNVDLDEVLYRAGDASSANERLADLYVQGAIHFQARDPKTLKPINAGTKNFDAVGLQGFEPVFTVAPGNRTAADARSFLEQFIAVLRDKGDFPVSVSVSATPFGFKKWMSAA